MSMERLPFALALDRMSPAAMAKLAQHAGRIVDALKVHAPVIDDGARRTVEYLAKHNARVWIDLKSDDMPDTVLAEVKVMKEAGASIATVHALGGIPMMKEAVSTGIEIYGVTLLTSLDDAYALRMFGRPRLDVVKDLAVDAKEAGCAGVVLSANEVEAVAAMNLGLKLVVPGTRSTGVPANDQKNVQTPTFAAAAGATILVLGRQVTDKEHPLEEIARVWREEVEPNYRYAA